MTLVGLVISVTVGLLGLALFTLGVIGVALLFKGGKSIYETVIF